MLRLGRIAAATTTASVLLLAGCELADTTTAEAAGAAEAVISHASRALAPLKQDRAQAPTVQVQAPKAASLLVRAPEAVAPLDPWAASLEDCSVKRPRQWDGLIERASSRHLKQHYDAVDGHTAACWLAAQMMQESSGNPKAVSATGCKGLMQLCKGTASDLGVRNREDPAESLDAGARYLAWCYRQWKAHRRTPKQRLPLAWVCYSDGLGTILKAQSNYGGIYFEDTRPQTCLLYTSPSPRD